MPSLFEGIKQNGYTTKFVNTSYKDVIAKQSIQKREQMPRKIHDKIIQKAYQSKYENGVAFDTARALGLRASEITNLKVKDFKANSEEKVEQVHIHRSKGGRNRDINTYKLSVEQQNTVQRTYDTFKQSRAENERLFTNKTQSYEKAFSRARDKVSSNYTHCGIHSMRKEFAKDFYSREMEKGRNDKEVKLELTQLLGHNRLEILESYLK